MEVMLTYRTKTTSNNKNLLRNIPEDKIYITYPSPTYKTNLPKIHDLSALLFPQNVFFYPNAKRTIDVLTAREKKNVQFESTLNLYFIEILTDIFVNKCDIWYKESFNANIDQIQGYSVMEEFWVFMYWKYKLILIRT